MAINKNHEFDELNGIKCAIVEKNVLKERVEFLKDLLEFNRFTVMVVPSPPLKVAAAPKAAAADQIQADQLQPAEPPIPPPAATFTVGVTNVAFNATNAIFGRLLRTRSGHF